MDTKTLLVGREIINSFSHVDSDVTDDKSYTVQLTVFCRTPLKHAVSTL